MKIFGRVYLLPDFDKPRRCPGWSGPGFVMGEKYDTGCKGGNVYVVPPQRAHIMDDTEFGEWHPYKGFPCDWDAARYVWDKPWSFGHCDECGVTTFPYVVRWLNWRWLSWVLVEKPSLRLRGRRHR